MTVTLVVYPVTIPIAVPFKGISVFLSGESEEYQIFKASLV